MNFFVAFFVALDLLVSHSQAIGATITAFSNDVKILDQNQSKFSQRMKFEGKDYSFANAKIGQKLQKGQVVVTGPSSKARIVYSDGTHIHLGSATFVKIEKLGDGQSKKNEVRTLDLAYGTLRALVKKEEGDKTQVKLQLKTPTAVAGVRGTDLVVKQGLHDVAQITVLSGEVSVASTHTQKTVAVESGKTLITGDETKVKEVVAETPRALIQEIVNETQIHPDTTSLDAETKAVEEQAFAVTVAELKVVAPSAPMLKDGGSAAALADAYNEKLIGKAPNPPAGGDPFSAYKKHFND